MEVSTFLKVSVGTPRSAATKSFITKQPQSDLTKKVVYVKWLSIAKDVLNLSNIPAYDKKTYIN